MVLWLWKSRNELVGVRFTMFSSHWNQFIMGGDFFLTTGDPRSNGSCYEDRDVVSEDALRPLRMVL